MKRFVVTCVIFSVVFFVLEKSLIFLRNSLPEKELDKRLELILNGKINADIIVMGSSRGARDIIASQLQDSLHTTAYNLSYPGSNVQFHEYLLTELLKNNNKKPKLLILAPDESSEFIEESSLKFRLDRLYPLVKYESIRNTLVEKGEKNEMLSALFIIHQLTISSFDLRKKHFKDKDTLLADGSMPISYQGKMFDRKYVLQYHNYSMVNEKDYKINSFKNILKLCSDNNIKLLFAFTPNFGKPLIGFKERMAGLTGNTGMIMMYDTSKPMYSNADYFFDGAHLKLNGATIFTSEVTRYITENTLLK